MRPITYQRATDAPSAVQALAAASANNPLTDAAVQPLAGGTTLLDLMKLDVMRPSLLVDINPLSDAWSTVSLDGGNLKLGALARMSDVADNPEIQRQVGDVEREISRLQVGDISSAELQNRLNHEILPNLESLEAQLRKQVDKENGEQVRSAAGDKVPAGYADSVAEYFRKLSKGK